MARQTADHTLPERLGKASRTKALRSYSAKARRQALPESTSSMSAGSGQCAER